MSKEFKDIDIQNCTYQFFYDMINIKNLAPHKIKIYKKLYKNILIYYIGYVKARDLRHTKIISVNPLYLIIGNINW